MEEQRDIGKKEINEERRR